MGARGRKGSARLVDYRREREWSPPPSPTVVIRLCAAFISDRGAFQATIWAALLVWASRGLPCVRGRHSAPPAGRSQKKLNRAQQLWHLSQRNPQAGGAAVVLTASALPALPRRSRLACYLKLLAWSATATGFPAPTAVILRGQPPSAAKK